MTLAESGRDTDEALSALIKEAAWRFYARLPAGALRALAYVERHGGAAEIDEAVRAVTFAAAAAQNEVATGRIARALSHSDFGPSMTDAELEAEAARLTSR